MMAAARKMLVVDDEASISAMFSKFFLSKGYDVRVVASGEEALALVKLFHPDVVLLDLMMPGMGGVETLKALKKLDPCPRIIMLSAANLEEVTQGALRLGADSFVCKPANLGELEKIVLGYYPPASG